MGNKNRNITKLEMLLAISMSQYYEKTHVHFVPPRTNFTKMLKILRSSKHIEPLGLSNYQLTKKGRDYIIRNEPDRFLEADKKVDEFIALLENNNCFGG